MFAFGLGHRSWLDDAIVVVEECRRSCTRKSFTARSDTQVHGQITSALIARVGAFGGVWSHAFFGFHGVIYRNFP
jgi:hypothetical protein